MAGKEYAGSVATAKVKESRAYCEGRKAAIDGGTTGDNPHPVGEMDHDAWDAGFASHGGGTAWDQDNCPDLGSDAP